MAVVVAVGSVTASLLLPQSAGATTAAAGYVSLAPCRLFDTRGTLTAPCSGAQRVATAPVGAGENLAFQFSSPAGSVAGLPSTTTAVVVNLTAVDATAATFVTAYPSASTRPTVSSLNAVGPAATPNLVTLPIVPDSHGVASISFYNHSGTLNLVADLEGYYDSASTTGFTAITPCRAFDSRGTPPFRCTSAPMVPANPVGSGGELTFDFSGVAGIPSTATAVTLNVTVVDATAPTYVTAFPAGSPLPHASNVNVATSAARPNQVIVGLTNGKATFYNNAGTADLIADIAGYYGAAGAALFTPLATPCRVFDSRDGSYTCQPDANSGAGPSPLGPGGIGSLGMPNTSTIPVGATAVVLNVTAVGATQPTYISVYPDNAPGPPNVSDLNVYDGNALPNQVTVAVPPGTPTGGTWAGEVDFFNNAGNIQVVTDAYGYFS